MMQPKRTATSLLRFSFLCLMFAGFWQPIEAQPTPPDTMWNYPWGYRYADGHMYWNQSWGARKTSFDVCYADCWACNCPGCAFFPDLPELDPCLTQDEPPGPCEGGEGVCDGGDCFCSFRCSMRFKLNGKCDSAMGHGTNPLPGDSPYGGFTLEPCLDNPDTSTNIERRYLPAFGDTLCYQVRVTRPMTVVVELSVSTYKGIAMNAAVPPGASHEKCDMWPVTSDGWFFEEQWYEESRCYVRVSRPFTAMDIRNGKVAEIPLYIMDYAAKGTLIAYNAAYPRYRQYLIPIPKNSFAFLSPDDTDSDGFTVWEEYRGFCNEDLSHFRLDTIGVERQILVIDYDENSNCGVFEDEDIVNFQLLSRLQEMMTCKLVFIPELLTSPVDGGWAGPYDAYERVDLNQVCWNASVDDWSPFSLAFPEPPYARPAPADWSDLECSSDQVAIRIANVLGTDYGLVFHEFGGPDWSYGICGNAGMWIRNDLTEQAILGWWLDEYGQSRFPDHGLLWDHVRRVLKSRTIAHEFGHVIDAIDHCVDQYCFNQCGGNNNNCVLKNEMTCPHPEIPWNENGEDDWWLWINYWDDDDDWGYLNDNLYHCADSLCYRP